MTATQTAFAFAPPVVQSSDDTELVLGVLRDRPGLSAVAVGLRCKQPIWAARSWAQPLLDALVKEGVVEVDHFTERWPLYSVAKPVTIQERFEAFHAANPEVYVAMVSLSRRAKAHGRRPGVKAVWEMLRASLAVEHRDKDYQLNNNFTSRYARLVMEREPDLAGFFEVRELKSA